MTYALLAVAFALVLGGALVFTNAVEWAGRELDLGQGAVGSVLAAVATALPESVIPVVALISGSAESEDVAVGAIVGAPFVLGTLAMAIVGLAAYAYRGRREHGVRLEPHLATLTRDAGFFLVTFGAATALGLAGPAPLRYAAAGLAVAAYVAYLVRSLRGGGERQSDEDMGPLYLDPTKDDPPHRVAIAAQSAAGVGMIVFGAHLLVARLEDVAERAGVAPLVLAVLIAPLATELPEKVNSVLWIRRGHDALALGNVTGAMAFQAAIPVAVGMAFTRWSLGRDAALACVLGLAGAALALVAIRLDGRFRPAAIAGFGGMFAAFVLVAFLAAG